MSFCFVVMVLLCVYVLNWYRGCIVELCVDIGAMRVLEISFRHLHKQDMSKQTRLSP